MIYAVFMLFQTLIYAILDKLINEVISMAERINQHKNPLVGSNIKRLRKERNMKAIEVIAKLQLLEVSVNVGTFSKVENGRNNPSVDMLIALTQIFKCDYNEFFKM